MGDAPAVVRVFWPHPSLPRISSEGGEDARSAGTEDEGPALVLVGWWHANARRGDDADDRDGARPAVSSVDVVVAGAAVSAVSFEDGGRDRGTFGVESSETLGPPVVLGSLVPPSAARSADSAHPRRAPKNQRWKNQSRDDDDDAPFACPVRLLARIGPRNPERGINKGNALERAVRLSYGSFVESDGDEPLVDVIAEARNAKGENVFEERFSKSENVEDSRRSYRARVVRYATPNPPGHALGSRDASAPYAWVLRAANEAGRLANARGVNTNDDNARKPREDVRGFTKKQKTKSAFPFFAFPSSTPSAYRAGLGLLCARLARALEVKWVPGLRQRHAWVAPRRRRRASDSDDADSDENLETGDVGDVARPSPFMFRDACELFASAKVIRSRARWFARGDDAPAVPADVGARCPSLRRAALFGRALQILLDLALGFALRSVLLANADALVAFAAGEDAVPPGGRKNARATTRSARTPPLGALIRANAEWLMRGSPLGVKLHAPLARALGGAAMTLVEALGVVCSTATFRRFVRACVEAVARAGPVGGASLSLALAADLTTFLSTHVAALHVYSSLLVTGQWHVGKRLALIVARNASVESATFGVLALTPLALLFPTTLAFYLSYLAIHAFTVVARASLVFAAAAAQHAPLEEIVAVCAHPKAFPGTTSVTARSRDGALFLRVDPAGVFETATAPFFSAAARWAAGTLRAVAEACGSLGRLPVALVPFEPDAADLFPDLSPGRGEKRRRGEVEVRRSR